MSTAIQKTDPDGQSGAISRLQWDAWEVANRSYHVPDGSTYLDLGRALYRQDLHEQIEHLFAKSDEQNAWLDACLAQAAREGRPAMGGPALPDWRHSDPFRSLAAVPKDEIGRS